MSHYIHHVPGRLRVRCQSLRSNMQRLHRISDTLKTNRGVYKIESKKHAGSITIHYHADMMEADELLAILKEHGCTLQTKAITVSKPKTKHVAKASPLSSKALGETVTRTLVGAVVGTLVRHTIEPPVVSLLKGAGIAK